MFQNTFFYDNLEKKHIVIIRGFMKFSVIFYNSADSINRVLLYVFFNTERTSGHICSPSPILHKMYMKNCR